MRILVVEDEKKIAQNLKKGLEQENFSVDVVLDGQSGYDLAISESYDLMVIDLMLPYLSGLELCKKLRASNIHTPIIMLTAKSETEDKIEGLDSGADDYLTKPFSFDELTARIRALLRRPKISIGQNLVVGDLVLNLDVYEVVRNHQEINLSRKEFALLEYLMRNKNIILSKQQIIDHVWNFEDDILPNTVEQYIGYLRNKIDKPFKDLPNLIHTIRGFGYSIKDNS